MTQSLPPKSFVLYADDDQDDIEFVREAFREYSNVELITFKDGIELLSYLRDLSSFDGMPCLIIIDINMPRLNGKEVLKKIRSMKDFEEVPVVLFSTSTLPSESAFAKSFNAGFVTKPLHAPQIKQISEHLIEHCSEEIQRRIRGKDRS